MSDTNSTPITRFLKATRKKRHQSQRKAAAEIGVHVVTLGRWEVGIYRPAMTYAGALAEWAGVTVAEVIELMVRDRVEAVA